MDELLHCKLISGEEVIAKIIEETDRGYIVCRPRMIVPTQDPTDSTGQTVKMNIVPVSYVTPDHQLEIHFHSIIWRDVDGVPEDIQSGYLQSTTSIQLTT